MQIKWQRLFSTAVFRDAASFRNAVRETSFTVAQLACVCVLSFVICSQVVLAQQVPLLQPGAPGQPNKVVTRAVGTAVKEPTAADFSFMRDMVMHHGQAVEMVGLMKGRTTNPQTLELGRRIRISQGGEIAFMKRWLAFYGKPLDESMADMDHTSMDMEHSGTQGMDHADLDMPPMPGMLSPRQMEALRNAKGDVFNHLFLTGMIQHHTGALSMVKELFDTRDGGQEPQLFDFTADVDVTQRAEIQVMQSMLSTEKK